MNIMDEPKKLTHIARELDLSVQESSRQLARLSGIELVAKDSDGFFNLQPYGRHAFRLFPGFQFLTEHVDYFNRHTLTGLPEKFMGRIGELRGCDPMKHLMGTFAKIEKVIKEADEFYFYMSDQNLVPSNLYVEGQKALDRGVQYRCIEPVGYQPPNDILVNVPSSVKEAFDVHRTEGNIVDRALMQIDVTLYMNEKEVAILAFPAQTGEFDYLGFSSTDPKVLEWCKDLHTYYWNLGGLRHEYYIAT